MDYREATTGIKNWQLFSSTLISASCTPLKLIQTSTRFRARGRGTVQRAAAIRREHDQREDHCRTQYLERSLWCVFLRRLLILRNIDVFWSAGHTAPRRFHSRCRLVPSVCARTERARHADAPRSHSETHCTLLTR